ncbi:MAG: CotH kinase family protein [Bacteroidetes bacterium]|nr:CotH kinase family protein [Bacteroidota bacterium]HET6244673.1 CotH kinase family protein [Bacteroidia bacterium]
MQIKKNNKEQRSSLFNIKPFLIWASLAVFIILTAYCIIFASKFIKTKGYTGLYDFISTASSNYLFSLDAKIEKVEIQFEPSDFNTIKEKRQLALNRNLIINEPDSYVPAIILHKGKKIRIKIRLKGHMTDHVDGEKWSYRVKVKDNDHFMGMRTFSLQHPGTRQYVYEWVYHKMLKAEHLIALRYKFINIVLNGKDLGIYAVEEHFDDELIADNNNLIGPVFRFNPNLYWVDRYNEILKDKVIAEFSSFSSSNFEIYREKKTLSDPVQFQYFLKGMALIEAFRRGELPADSVFDIKKQAKFYAVMDLMGGHFSMDWSDVKFYYNPITSRLEPVGYESCSLYPTKKIAGSARYKPLEKGAFINDFHNNLFSNPAFFKEYIKQLEIVAEKEYLDNFFASIDKDLNQNLKIIYSEFAYKKFDKELYYKNQKSIKRILDTPKGFHAFFDGKANDSLLIQLGVIESLPIEILGIMLNDSVISKPLNELILSAKLPEEYVNYKGFSFVLPQDLIWKNKFAKKLSVKYRILGASTEKSAEVFPYPYKDKNWLKEDLLNQVSNMEEFTFLTVNKEQKVVFIRPGKWQINKNMIIPQDYIVKASENTVIDLINNARIVSYSALDFSGNEKEPIVIFSSDLTGQGIVVLNASLTSNLKHVHFKELNSSKDNELKLSGAVTFYESEVNITNCYFTSGNNEDILTIIRSSFRVNKCLFENLVNDALDIKFSNGSVSSSSFVNCIEDAIDITASNVLLKNITINKAGNKGLNAKAHSEVKGENIKIFNSNIAVSAEDFANIILDNVTIKDSKIAFVSFQNKPEFGPAFITATNVVLENNVKKSLVESKSKISINGVSLSETIKNVEALLKQDINE